MKYLVVSDAGSMHVYNFIKNNLMGRGWEIYVLSHSVVPIPNLYMQFYKENNIKVISTIEKSYANKTGLIYKLRKLYFKYKCLRQLGSVDVCHIHCLASSSCLLYLLIRKRIKHLILTFWGSDILKNRKGESFLQKKCFPYADCITLSTERTYNVFLKKFGSFYKDRLYLVRFISGALKDIKFNLNCYTRKECKEYLGFPTDKYIVMLGYNADPDQHQDKCVNALRNIDNKLKNQIYVVVPMQYARSNQVYIDKVKDALSVSGFPYCVLEKYFDSKEMAILSIATDIYVNVRATDAFSCCMKEQLYSGTYMIQGDWLEYIELESIKWPIEKISSIEQLANALSTIIKKYPESIPKRQCDLMWKLFSPEGVRTQWDAVYKQIGIL